MIIKNVILTALLACGLSVYGQQNQYLTVSKDGRKVGLSAEGASFLAQLPLHCIQAEYPNKPNHTLETAQEVTLSPKQLHPAFYGCLDWHSSVHGHWMLVKILKTYPNLPETQQIIDMLESSLLPENLQKEADYFSQYKLAKGFERTYGWAWLLKLDEELLTWDNPMAKRWHKSLQPLTQVIVQRWAEYLPKQTYPNRTGVHPNTAFGMVFALDWARTAKNTSFEQLLVQRSKDYYLNNKAVAATLEPDGTDFLSPSLEIADLMRRVLAPQAFQKWFNQFYTPAGLKNVLQLPIVSDRSDYQIVHLDGLALSKAWCLLGIAKQLPTIDLRKKQFQEKATTFLQKTLPNIANGNYGGDHWLGSFAMYALSLEVE